MNAYTFVSRVTKIVIQESSSTFIPSEDDSRLYKPHPPNTAAPATVAPIITFVLVSFLKHLNIRKIP